MSNNESFIDEVTEEVRRDQLYGYIRKYGWIAVVVIVGMVGAAGYAEFSGKAADDAARAKGEQLLSALDQDQAADRLASLQAADASPLQKLLEGAAALEAEDPAAAIAAYDALAADATATPIYKSIAVFKSTLLKAPDMTAQERMDAWLPMTVPGQPMRLLAKEQIALAQVAADDTAAALATIEEILVDAGITQGLRTRVEGLKVALGGAVAE